MQDNQTPSLFGQTPWQTVGPFFHFALPWDGAADLVGGSRPRERVGPPVELFGLVLDGNRDPVPDAMIETWQTDSDGLGFGRSCTDKDGVWRLRTSRPDRAPAHGNRPQSPHLVVGIFGRGLIKRLVTRIYFDGAPDLQDDPILALVPPGRRATLIAHPNGGAWRFDIILQGAGETVFFDI